LFDQLSRLSGRPTVVVALPLPRLLMGLKSGSVAFAVLAGTDDRDVFAERVCEVGKLSFSLAVRKSTGTFRSLPELSGRTYATIRGAHDHVTPQLTKLVPQPVTNMTQGFSMLSVGRVDAALCARPGCATAMRNAGINAGSVDYLPLLTLPLVIYATKASSTKPDFEADKAFLKERCMDKQTQAHFVELLAQFD
jgi:polar amino acid transport system substrate-binding protein